MRAPIRPLPDGVTRWIRGARYLRALDAVAAWLAVWAVATLAFPDGDAAVHGVIAAVLAIAAARVPWLRVRWRPVMGAVALAVSRRLRPGDRAWYIRSAEAELVLVTARRRLRIVIARVQSAAEGMSVRRTRVLLLPAD